MGILSPPDILRIDPRDDVGVALRDLVPGEMVDSRGIAVTPREPVPAGHKVALKPVARGAAVRKYGAPIGRAKAGIAPGDWVHLHNLETALSGKVDYLREQGRVVAPAGAPAPPPRFRGYRRRDGRIGIRNEIWLLSMVGCVNKQIERLARLAGERLADPVDGIYAFGHPYGCSQLGEDLENTRRVLAALASHPNAGGVLVAGLGCEENRLEDFQAALGDYDRERIRFLLLQEAGDETTEALGILADLAAVAGGDRREEVSAAGLVVGLKCGGSDGFSGLTANPLAGLAADAVVAWGGGALLGEVPEMFGAETLLMARARDEETRGRIAALINGWKDYYLRHGHPVSENPSPGNERGGITTLEEKSLGAVMKGGSSPVVDILRYGETAGERGLCLVDSPGNDAVSTTALAAAGAQLILFTTGRGTPYGGPVPTLKIAANSELARRKPHWIDFDAGRILAGETPDDLALELVELILRAASGEVRARNEINGDREIAIFKSGVTL